MPGRGVGGGCPSGPGSDRPEGEPDPVRHPAAASTGVGSRSTVPTVASNRSPGAASSSTSAATPGLHQQDVGLVDLADQADLGDVDDGDDRRAGADPVAHREHVVDAGHRLTRGRLAGWPAARAAGSRPSSPASGSPRRRADGRAICTTPAIGARSVSASTVDCGEVVRGLGLRPLRRAEGGDRLRRCRRGPAATCRMQRARRAGRGRLVLLSAAASTWASSAARTCSSATSPAACRAVANASSAAASRLLLEAEEVDRTDSATDPSGRGQRRLRVGQPLLGGRRVDDGEHRVLGHGRARL